MRRENQNQNKKIVPLSKPLKIKVQKRDSVGKEYTNIKLPPESPIKPGKAAFMMTGMTCTITENNKDLDMFDKTIKTAERSRDQDSALGAFNKSITGVSPVNKTIYGVQFFGDNDSQLRQHTNHMSSVMNSTQKDGRKENFDNFNSSFRKKKSDLDQNVPRNKMSPMSRARNDDGTTEGTQGTLYQ